MVWVKIILRLLLHWILVEVGLALGGSQSICHRVVVLEIWIVVELVDLGFEGVAVLVIKMSLHVSSNDTGDGPVVLHI